MVKIPLTTQKLVKQFKTEKKRSLKDCWMYHKDLMKENKSGFTKANLENDLCDLDLKDWEDVGFFVGYIRGLDFAINALQPEEE